MYIFFILLFFTLSGFSEAVMDTLQFHYDNSIFKNFKNNLFWDPYHSWRNKYKGGDSRKGEKFPFSTTLLVGLTDAWHFFKLLRNLSLFIGVFFIFLFSGIGILKSLILTLVMRFIFGVSFTIAYKKMGD